MKHKQSASSKTAKQLLDQSTIEISQRHRVRLEQMTMQAVAHRSRQHREKRQSPKQPRSNKYRPFAFPLAMASSVMFVLWLWWPLQQTTAPQNNPAVVAISPSNTGVPEWVTDTEIPISLLDNMAFYDWLAKQKDEQNHG